MGLRVKKTLACVGNRFIENSGPSGVVFKLLSSCGFFGEDGLHLTYLQTRELHEMLLHWNRLIRDLLNLRWI